MAGWDRLVVGLGYTWEDGAPLLHTRPLTPRDSSIRSLRLAKGDRLRIGVTSRRRCTGYRGQHRARACPEDAVPSGTQCTACQGRDTFRRCMTCDGFRCPPRGSVVDSYCRKTHHLYLACFGDQTIKVGTASDPRRIQRIVEQGPLAAARVARAQGPTIKQMEHILAKEAFTEAMRRSTKVRLLRGIMREAEARELVSQATRTLPKLLPEPYHDHLHPPVFVAQPALARASRGLPVLPLPVEGDTLLDGVVIGAVGHVVFLDDGDGCFALDLGELKARILQLDPSRPQRKPAVQLGLFDR